MNADPPSWMHSGIEPEQLDRIETKLDGVHWKLDTLVRLLNRMHLSTTSPGAPLPRARPHRSGTQLPPILRHKLLHTILGWVGERLVGYLLPFIISLGLGAWTYGRTALHKAIDFLTWLAG